LKINSLKIIFSLLSKREKVNFVFIIIIAIIVSIIDLIGVGSIMPFISVVSNPNLINENKYLYYFYNHFNFSDQKTFIITLGILVLFFVIIQNASHAILNYLKIRYTTMRRHSLSLRLFKIYLSQPYYYFLNKNSYDFNKNINTEIEILINGTLTQLVDITSYGIQILFLIIFLFFINPFSTLIISFSIISIYAIVYFFIRRTLKKLGTDRYKLNTECNRIVNESFWGIKEVKIAGIESSLIKSYSLPSKQLSFNLSKQEIISDLPKYLLETTAFSAIILIILFMILKSQNIENVMVSVSVFAYAGYRLMPSIQKIFKAFSKFKYSIPASERIFKEFNSIIYNTPTNSFSNSEVLPFNHSIKIENIFYSYPQSSKYVLQNISLTIKKNSIIGIVGSTGSGKTTLIDIILGLLIPNKGRIYIDDIELNDGNIRSWQKNLGYVPQNIYLSNSSIAENVAFGLPKDAIDMDAVKKACHMAQIDSFIEEELPDKYNTYIGERGIKLSGGQRQRIGIARALYHNPSLLIFDEATAALDMQTEQAVIDAINTIVGTKTIIMIAHRISTLESCNMIYRLEKGKITEQGEYNELFKK